MIRSFVSTGRTRLPASAVNSLADLVAVGFSLGANMLLKFLGEAGAASDISGGALANVVGQAPIAGNNIANIANCSDFLNHNLNDNLSGNSIAIL